MANCKFILTTDSGVLEFRNEAELDSYLEYKVLFGSTPFSKYNANEIKNIRNNIQSKIKSLTKDTQLKKLDKSGNEIHKYENSKGDALTSVTEWIREKMKWVEELDKNEYRANTQLKVASDLLKVKIDDINELNVLLKDPNNKQQVDDYYTALFAEWDLAPSYGTELDKLFNTAVDMFNNGGLTNKREFIDYVKTKIADPRVATDIAKKLWNNFNIILKQSKAKGEKVVLLSQQVLMDKNIAGSPDLLVVVLDEFNKPKRVDVYDLKMSFKQIDQSVHQVKLNTYMYQTLTYSRMINRMLGLKEGNVYLLNHQMNVPNKTNGKLDDVQSIGDINLIDVKIQKGVGVIQANIDTALPAKELAIKKEDFIPVTDDIEEFMEQYFGFNPINTGSNRTKSIEALKAQGKEDRNSANIRNYRMPDGSSVSVKINDDKAFEEFAEKYNKAYQEKLSDLSNSVVKFIQVMRKNPDINFFEYDGVSDRTNAKGYLLKGLQKYIEDPNWEVFELEGEIKKELSKMGIVLMYNSIQKKVDVVVASSYNLKKVHKPLNSTGVTGNTIAGNFYGDSKVDAEGFSKMDYGTLEAIKGALYVFTQKQLFKDDIKVGRVVAVSGSSAPSPARYIFPTLQEVKRVRDVVNKTKKRLNTKIELDGIEDLKSNTYDLVDDVVTDLIHMTSSGYLNDENYRTIGAIFGNKETTSEMSDELAAKLQKGEREELIVYLKNLVSSKMAWNGVVNEKTMSGTRLHTATEVNRLLGEITTAIKYLEGLDVRKQKDLNKLTMNFQNADAIESEVAKEAVDIVTDAVRNVNAGIKQFVNVKTKKLRELKERLITEIYPGGQIASYVIGTHDYVIYNNMFELDTNGKRTMYFKDPKDLTNGLLPLEREFLTEYLSLLNTIRQEKYSKSYPKLAKEFAEDTRRQLEVPLNFATGYTALMQNGIIGYMANKMKVFTSDLETFTNDDDAVEAEKGDRTKIFDYFMYNDVQRNRDARVSETDPNEFEGNLEYLLYDYEAAKLKQVYYDKALENVKIMEYALAFHRLNTTSGLPNTGNWISGYTDRVMLGRKDYGTENKRLVDVLNKIQGFASFGIIALNPFSGATAFMSNMFGIMSATISKNAIEKNYFNMKDAGIAIGHMAKNMENLVGNDNFVETLNRTYEVSNMDKYQLLNNMKDRRGVMKWLSRMMYWFNSAPDYYWRMVVFMAQMEHDGVLQAHDKDGIYDYRKDPRYAVYVHNTAPKTSEAYLKAKALFDFMVKELKATNPIDGIKIEDGLEVPNLAYTRAQRNGIKKYADSLLGSYDDEIKGGWANYIFGRIFMQFKNFMISKKNIWIAEKHAMELPQPKMVRGFFKEQEDGFRLFVPDEKGDDFIYENQGTYSEGLVMSMLHLFKATRNNYIDSDLQGYKRFAEAAKQTREEFERWRLAGIVHGISDLWMWFLLGLISGFIEDETSKNTHWINQNLAKSFKNAYKDLAPWEIAKAIGISNTLPFPAIGYIIRLQQQGIQVLTGDRELSQYIINNLGITRNYSKLFNDAFSD